VKVLLKKSITRRDLLHGTGVFLGMSLLNFNRYKRAHAITWRLFQTGGKRPMETIRATDYLAGDRYPRASPGVSICLRAHSPQLAAGNASEIKMAQLTLHLEDSLLLAAGSFNFPFSNNKAMYGSSG